MPFQKINAGKLSKSVVEQIELLILRGVLRPGERLPSERDLSDRMGVSRPSLREAVSELQETGLLETKAGSGIFVSDRLDSSFSPALTGLLSRHDEAVYDYIDFRRDLEGLAVERAARMASDTDLKVIDSIFKKMEAAPAGKGADLDADFHSAIVEASHNVMIVHVMRAMYDLLKRGVLYNRKVILQMYNTRADLLQQHREINDGIQARDPARARAAVEAHMDYVTQSYSDFRRAERNEEVARLRLEHEQEK
ncbi:FadR/GntR family transcriptional regulator [Aliiroseovarius lamellibrachiae]|uniref:FadR/GntR family transcriptional regulator n=1 Tax=Aliiroseovarius lamellibrachiae TaxID=1924933 RepID=UPI001BE0BEA3|nr:FadR/GntR family transcriptional regulator [Aliiroseovarius lamellibrachiae]MBT2129803.1 FadR family transcriptional regulator [Aliiroseovarius lamellibrachiae]